MRLLDLVERQMECALPSETTQLGNVRPTIRWGRGGGREGMEKWVRAMMGGCWGMLEWGLLKGAVWMERLRWRRRGGRVL